MLQAIILVMNLMATCGNTTNPCPLNIDITRGTNLNVFKILEGAKSNLNEQQIDIIRIKLNLLFNYSKHDEETTEEFQSKLESYSDNEKFINSLESIVVDIIDNPKRKEALDENEIILFNLITELKRDIERYKKDPTEFALQQIVDTTVNNIIPEANKIRMLKYSVNSVIYDSDDDTYHLIQLPYRDRDVIINLGDEPIVTNFIVGTKRSLKLRT